MSRSWRTRCSQGWWLLVLCSFRHVCSIPDSSLPNHQPSCFSLQRRKITFMKVPFSFNISVSPAAPLAVDVSGVPTTAQVGVAYSGVINASGGTPPYTFTLNSPLPDGLTLNSDGTITGTPTKDGSFSVSGTVADSLG